MIDIVQEILAAEERAATLEQKSTPTRRKKNPCRTDTSETARSSFITPKLFAFAAQVHLRQLKAWDRSGTLVPAFNVGGAKRYSPAQLQVAKMLKLFDIS